MIRSPFGSAEPHVTRSSRARAPRRNLAGAALVVGGFLAAPVVLAGAPASAAPVPHSLIAAPPTARPTPRHSGPNVVTVRFSYNKNAQTWIVPSNAITNSICLDASGAQGGAGSAGTFGTGGTVNMVPSLSAGQSLQIYLGQQGSSASAGGGGGNGGGGAGGPGAGGGGGSSQVFTQGSLLLATGGGGGGGAVATGGAGGPTAG